mgnify:CR=1 FL=1
MVKKVGILFGMEDTYPWAFIDKVNELGKGEVIAEALQIDKVQQGIDYGYSVIFDRISQYQCLKLFFCLRMLDLIILQRNLSVT